MTVLVIGIGNEARRDDGVGIAAVHEIAQRRLPGVEAMVTSGDPGELLDAWAGVPTVIAVDAAVSPSATPGTVRRWTPADLPRDLGGVSSHALGLAGAYRLGEALGQSPGRLIVLTVDVVDVGYGFGMTDAVAGAVPDVVAVILREAGLHEAVRDV
ncbi:hydrogenase maturation protease [Mycolicibacterium smegmatis]|jgi:hydrogenase maturation protease|uniref:Peptidase M52, hydrogen uptake protein n=3 Tax=Mycolicibacterium smegmatis TaxID=1772 RepID=A0QZ78_MYCS2|nr:hydrogenase maturation protease [Mycolicibacterium smegmatis]ABK75673.1 peptidase M52, hydrogen uptake protein [Mycolicibacterium smegmatis MC2 155]AFP40295.1 Hydrogenase maturation protease [Mycolicibacterium smegmatis MC2 155]AIU09043.1 peptidase M52 [Mycolicibacterium smegmatis MC2 155]AIU15668.1 peptidase M52 [Mycolicibacterium smegmatis]AIU22291.1 peptidase M52 [Mycolicibacterium smegmatis]